MGTRNYFQIRYWVLDFGKFRIGYPKFSDWVSAHTRFDRPSEDASQSFRRVIKDVKIYCCIYMNEEQYQNRVSGADILRPAMMFFLQDTRRAFKYAVLGIKFDILIGGRVTSSPTHARS